MPRTEVTGSQIKDQSVSLTADVTGTLPVANGGTGSTTLTLNNVLLGNGTGALQAVAPGASGNVLTSDGSTWVSQSGIVTLTGTQTLTNKSLTSPTITGTPVTTVLAAAAPAGDKSTLIVPMSTDLDSNASAFMPGLHNTLAYNIERGGTLTLTKNATPVTVTNPERLFNGGFTEAGGWLSYPTDAYGTATTTDVFEFTVGVNTQIPRIDLGIFGIQMAHVWAAGDVKIEVFFSGAWTTIYDVTNVTVNASTPPLHFIRYAGHGSNPISQIRYTLKNIPNGLLRVLSLFYIHSTSSSTVFLRSNGGRLFGTNASPPTLTAAGGDTNISLNLVAKGTGTVQAGGVPVVTTTGTQTLTGKTLSGATPVATGGTIDLYNTADQTTNTERVTWRWTSNVGELAVLSNGTGSNRTLRLGAGTQGSGVLRYIDITHNTSPFINLGSVNTGLSPIAAVMNGSQLTSGSTVQTVFQISPTANQSGTGGYTCLLINPTEAATGSGTKRLISAQVGGTDRFSVNSAGVITTGTTATIRAGAGTPEGAVTAPVGSLYLRTDGAAGTTLYVKESGTGNTGWIGK